MPLGDSHDNTPPVRKAKAFLIPATDFDGQVSATANVNLAATLEGVTLNGYELVEGDYVLLTAQTAPAENGVYTVVASPGVPTRATEFNTAAEYETMRDTDQRFVETQGDNIGRKWRFVNQGVFTLGTTAALFAEHTATAISLGS